jgi:hypothetical protein
MLPDYQETKRLFTRFFQTYARRKARVISPFAAVQTRYLHEGRGMKVMRADESESNTETQQLSSMMEIKFDEIPDLTFEKAIAKYDEMILDMVHKQTGLALERLSEDIPKSQNVDAKGKKLDAEIILEMLETIQLEFYPDGRPHDLHVVGGLFTPERLKAVDEEFQNNPELQKRHNELMERKREEWRAREADRKLVG